MIYLLTRADRPAPGISLLVEAVVEGLHGSSLADIHRILIILVLMVDVEPSIAKGQSDSSGDLNQVQGFSRLLASKWVEKAISIEDPGQFAGWESVQPNASGLT